MCGEKQFRIQREEVFYSYLSGKKEHSISKIALVEKNLSYL